MAPIERDAKPESDMPELLIHGMRSAEDEAVSECFRQGFKDVRRRRVGAAAGESFLKFIHADKSKSTGADCQ